MKCDWILNIRLLLFVALLSLVSCAKDSGGVDQPIDPGESDMEQIDDMVYSYMSRNSVPGATLAVAKEGKLVYAKAYGFADKETGDRMTTNTRVRISSISKTVTAIAIMKLVEEGKINLDDKIFGPEGLLGDDYGTQRPYRQYITDLTVKHCLSHHVGGWGNASNDPTGLRNDLDAPSLISYIIDNISLSAAPGSSYAYSNVGFMILGRVIESVSQKSYEQYVKDAILTPIGISAMEIGGNTLADQKENESRYHQAGAYTANFARRDANGGWIATASDLVNLFLHADGFSSVPDILSQSTIQTMTTPPFAYRNYAMGIYVNGGKWYHGGSFSGNRSHFVRTSSGLVAAILVNNNATNLADLLDDIVSASVTWPSNL